MRQETFKFGDLAQLILKIWQYIKDITGDETHLGWNISPYSSPLTDIFNEILEEKVIIKCKTMNSLWKKSH